jgi:hypothetical protein
LDVRVGDSMRLEDSPFLDARTPSFPPYACGECGLWECNDSPSWSVWVRRGGPHVFWIPPFGDVDAFDGAAYSAALGGNWMELPTVDATELAHRTRRRGLSMWPIFTARVGDRVVDWFAGDDYTRLFYWPDDAIAELEFVAPPSHAIELRADDEPKIDPIWAAFEDGRWRMYFSDAFALPSWIAAPLVDEIAQVSGLARAFEHA